MATTTVPYTLTVGEPYDPVLINAIFSALTIGAIIGSDIATGTITGSNIASATIEGSNIIANAIGSSHIASNTISADHIQSDAITATKIKSGAVTTDKIYAGAITADKMSVTSLSSISANLGEVTAGTLTAPTIQTSANPAVSRVLMTGAGITGYSATLGQTFRLPVDGSAPQFVNGTIESCTIIDSTMISNDFKTSNVLPWVELATTGVAYRESGSGGLYGTAVYVKDEGEWATSTDYHVGDYIGNDGTHYDCTVAHTSGASTEPGTGADWATKWQVSTSTYGAGVTGYYGNSSKPLLSVEKERTYADIHMYNRSSSVPSGASTVGDLCVIDGELRICVSPGTGAGATWTVIGERPKHDITLVAGQKLIFDGAAI